MNINRHNYEEYFILYMDNELSSEDRRMVEDFVLQHPDLNEELEILAQFKLKPDPLVVYPGREELMKVNGTTPVTLSNYEEWLVLYADNELAPEQQKQVELLATANPVVQRELLLIQKAKLIPENITFINKADLYRHEEKTRRIPMRYWKVAAAIFIALLGLTTLIIITSRSGNSIDKDVADIPVPQQKSQPDQSVVKSQLVETTLPVIKKDKEVINKNDHTIPDNFQTNQTNLTKRTTIVKQQKSVPVQQPEPEKEVYVDNNKPSNNLPQPLNTQFNKTDATNRNVVAKIDKETSDPKTLTNKAVTAEYDPTLNNYAMHASLKDDNDVAINEPAGKKSKLRGFLRKLTRTFEKRTNIDATDEDDKLLVGGLAFKLK